MELDPSIVAKLKKQLQKAEVKVQLLENSRMLKKMLTLKHRR